MIPIPTSTCVSNFDILAETGKVFLDFTHTDILTTLIFNTMKKESCFESSKNDIMTLYLLRHFTLNCDVLNLCSSQCKDEVVQ